MGVNFEIVVPVAVRTIRETAVKVLRRPICGAWQQVGPEEMGVMAYNVCGLAPHLDDLHKAGWSDGGEWFKEGDRP